jgi:AcrR family transcriptional regulator
MPRTQVRAAAAREQQGEATRGRLVELAVAALERGGEQAIKVREIANALDVSVGAVYHHFESRRDLIVAARIAQFEAVITGDVDAVRDLVERSETVDELWSGMQFLTRAAHSDARARSRRLRAEVAGVALHHPDLSAGLARAQDACTTAFTEIIVEGQRKGLVRRDLDARAVATLLQGVSLGLVLNDINLVTPMDAESWFALTDQVYRSLLVTD